MLFLVDGYNVVMKDPTTAGLDKEAQRDALVTRLGTSARRVLGAGDVVVVFDARMQLGTTAEKIAGLTVVYAADADDEIVRRAARATGQVVVVTNDMRLRARLSQDVSRRIEYRESDTVFASSTHGQRRPTGSGEAPDRELPMADADDITKELEKLWIPEDE